MVTSPPTTGWIEFQGKIWRIAEWDWTIGGPHRIRLVGDDGEGEILYFQEPLFLPMRPKGPDRPRVD
jgi:hypothetical protein